MKKTTINKKAAIELSIGTVVIIVLAMTMLILGLVLVRSIFAGATESVDALNDQVKAEITNIFSEEGSKIAIKLGSNRLAKIKQGTNDFGIGIGAKTAEGVNVVDGTAKNLYYKLAFTTGGDCDQNKFKDYIQGHTFISGSTQSLEFDDTEADRGFMVLFFDIPDGAGECTQKIKITTCPDAGCIYTIATSTFRVQIISGGIFS